MFQAITIPCALLGFFGGAAYFGALETDPTKPIMVSHALYNVVTNTEPIFRELTLFSSTESALLVV